MYYTHFNSQIGTITLIGDTDGIQRLYIHNQDAKYPLQLDDNFEESTPIFSSAIAQIEEYLAGSRTTFDLKLNPQGTPFQQSVWKKLIEIPFGKTSGYGEIAKDLNNPNASRAVGAANGKNPIPLIIPCHRVIGANGKLTGFAFGTDLKQQLLDLENIKE